MSKKKQLMLGAVNISMSPPHTPERYIALFQDASKLELGVRLRGDWVGRLGAIRLEDDTDGEKIVKGEFYKYIELDLTKDWFNVIKGKPAEEREIEKISIPKDLRPHFQHVPFVFFAKKGVHRLILITREGSDTLSSVQAADILKATFSSFNLLEVYQKTEVTVEPARDSLDRIFSLPRLRSLRMEISPPNPDDFEDFDKAVYQEMDEQQADRLVIELREADGRGLKPNKKTKELANVAQSNGKVVGTSGERGKTKPISTSNYPLIERATFEEKTETRSAALLSKAKEIVKNIKSSVYK